MTRRPSRSRTATLLALLLGAALVGLLPLGAGPAHAAPTYPPLSATVTGPTTVGTLLSENYTVTVSGGPATAANGTVVGSYTYKATFTAANRTGITFGTSPEGVIVNGSLTLKFTAGNVTEPVTLGVLVTSTYQGTNTTQNATLLINIVQPYILTATLVVGSGAGVAPFDLVVQLDGAAVGTIPIPSLTPGQSYPVNFRYVNTNLAPGTHTFSVSLVSQHGLVTFPGGAETYSQSFYVEPPPADNTVWYLAGAAAFLGAIVIWSMRVGARRRGKAKK